MPFLLKDFPNTKLLILGIGDMENELRSIAHELGIDDKIIMKTEFVTEEERIRHYAAADVVVIPSLYEPFGIVCTEALSMEKPTVVGARGTNGMREQVIPSGENQCGIHVNPFEPKDIAWGITQVLQSPDKGLQWGKNGRQRVRKEFSWEAVTRRTIAIYEEFLR
jgi:glycosyltransferase involved in cell wall biosynthesis